MQRAKGVSVILTVVTLLVLSWDYVFPQNPILQLPYPIGESWILTRGYESGDTHNGIDKYALDFTLSGCGSWNKPIKASAGGTVQIKSAVDNGGYGIYLVINHGNGYETLYGHLNEITASNGQIVKMGDQIGRCGNTGHAEGQACPPYPGTHLHYRITKNGVAIKPEPLSGYSNFDAKEGSSFLAIPLKHSHGSILRTQSNPDLYLIENSQKHRFENFDIWVANGQPDNMVLYASQDELNGYSTGNQVVSRYPDYSTNFVRDPDDQLFKISGQGSTVWLFDSSQGKKRKFVLNQVYNSWKYPSDFSSTATLYPGQYPTGQTEGDEMYFRDGTLIKGANATVYVMSQGYARPLENQQVFDALGYNSGNIISLPQANIDNKDGFIGYGETLTASNIWQSEYQMGIAGMGGDGSGDEPIATTDPVIGSGWTIQKALTCKSIDANGNYVNAESEFTGSDTYAYAWVWLSNVVKKVKVKMEWVRPDGAIYQTDTTSVGPISQFYFHPKLYLYGLEENTWHARVSIDGVAERELAFSVSSTQIPILHINEPTSGMLDFSFDKSKAGFIISNVGFGMMDCYVTTSASWLTLKYSELGYHSEKYTDSVYVSRTGLADGDYTGYVYLESNGGRDTITVTMQKYCYARAIFYPCSDGYTSSPWTDWNTAHNQAVGYGAATTQTIADNPGSAQAESNWKISRGSVCYNTAPLGSAAHILSATLGLCFSQKNGGNHDYYHIVSSGQTNPSLLAKEDYGKFGSTSFASIYTNEVVFDRYILFALNSAGIANVNPAGYSKFGMRIGSDLNNQQPSSTPYNCGLRVYMSECGDQSKMPYLEVVYEIVENLAVSPTALDFGSATAALPITIASNTSWTITKSASWLSLSVMSGAGNATVNATADRTSLPFGNSTATITVTGAGKAYTVNATATKSQSTTARFYVTKAGDGYANKGFNPWSTARNATTGGAVYGQTIAGCFGSIRHDQGNGGWDINRGLFGVNTGSIPDNATITSATIGIWFERRNGTSNDTWNIVAGSQASLASLIGDDYDNVGSTSFASMQVSAATFGGYTEFTLNAAGLSQISKTGDTKFGTRLGCDLNNQEPSTPFECGLRAFMFEYGNNRQPYIRVTYTVPLSKDVAETNEDATVPTEFALSQNYPNPFNPETTISFALPQASNVKLTVYDLLGKEVAVIVDEWLEAGEQNILFNASSLPSGTYFYRLRAGDFTAMRKMVLLK